MSEKTHKFILEKIHMPQWEEIPKLCRKRYSCLSKKRYPSYVGNDAHASEGGNTQACWGGDTYAYFGENTCQAYEVNIDKPTSWRYSSLSARR
ncbi:hypothetical protein PoB_006804000 [Plakobranchus ocellatus]|uniref:Uncharacterized protein n=1 Tax=Plakobranchus ocellatus TaxID=259542 RepID=A0AAV4DC56_9GAST|nr:hypothetical protein PoB_006804000 [Plakobranchus ocellatus]